MLEQRFDNDDERWKEVRQELKANRDECGKFFDEYRKDRDETIDRERDAARERGRNALALLIAAFGLFGTLLGALVATHVI